MAVFSAGKVRMAPLLTALLLAACAHAAAPRTDAPPLENGVYVTDNICQGEGGCDSMHWRVGPEPIPLRATVDPAAPAIATLQPGEYVDVLDGQVRTVPRRGVVKSIDVATAQELQQPGPRLAVGDVVYMIGTQGEGWFDLWRRGDTVTWVAPDDATSGVQIAWEPETPPQPGAILGLWVRVKRANGQTGWASGAFECVSKLAGDDDCESGK